MKHSEFERILKHGLKENWKQFAILVLVNAFVGGMIGMERSIFPQFAADVFGIASKTAILSFITAFGITKAITNYFAGRLSNKLGRKNLLLLGWIIALPIPFILMYASSWSIVIFANVLLGISQGLTWSTTVVMKIDLVGEKDRGLAMGINEFAGYFAVGIVAFLSGFVATKYGVTPYPFYIGIAISFIGFLITLIWVKDTTKFVDKEITTDNKKPLDNVFIETSFKNKTLSSVTQAGLVNNLNDGMIWGLLPIMLMIMQYNAVNIGIVTAIYPAVWGISQLFTGKMADIYPKKRMLFWGMLLQGIAIIFIPISSSFEQMIMLSIILGLATALVYPTFLSTIAEGTNPKQRAESIGTFRLWRDLGYAVGAIISGITADIFGVAPAIYLIGAITILSAWVLHFRMPNSIKAEKICIEVGEVQQAILHNEKIIIIDVRTKDEFDLNHIPNAININLNELTQHISRLDKSNQLITVCGKGGGRSSDAAKLLKSIGYKVNWLCGGNDRWFQQTTLA